MPILTILLNFLNIKKILPIILKNWKEILIVSMGFILWYQNYSETRFLFGTETIPSLEKRLNKAIGEIKECADANENLQNTIDETNKKVEEWKSISSKLEGNVKKLEKELYDIRNTTNDEINSILNDKTPETCKDAMDYLRDARKDLTW